MDAQISAPTGLKYLLRRRTPWLLALVVVAATVAWLGPRLLFADDPAAQLPTALVELGDIEKTVTAVGSLKPKVYVDVGTQVSGQLQKVHVEIGDRVIKGDLIAEIDPTRYESTVRKDRANLENLQAQLGQQLAEAELSRQQLVRNRDMLREFAVSQDTVDQAAATFKVATAKVAATRAQIKAAEATLEGDLANLGYTKIYAPIDGTIVSQTTLEGQTVNANQSTPVIVQVANLEIMTVWAQVAEADVNKIEPGMPVYFTTLGMPQRRWQGQVRQVQPTPEVTNDVVLYNVLVDVENKESLLLPSMTVQTFFVLGEAHGVPLAPMSALQADPGAGRGIYRATVMTPKGPEQRQVQIGVANRTSAEIVSGLAVGERVVLAAGSAPAAQAQRRGARMMGPHL